jgi:hypothetical protein
MATNKGGHRPAGGIHSRQVVSKPVRTGQRAERVHQGGAGQIGIAQGSHVMDRRRDSGYRGEPLRGALRPAGGPGGVPLGNELSVKTVCGPGGPRNLYGQSGTNQQYGAPNPGNAPNKSTDILRQFGADYKAPRS